jgi:signal transduction histidine kinase/ActR/RegA family two-component response regulator
MEKELVHLLQFTPEALLFIVEGKVEFANDLAMNILGINHQSEIFGHTINHWLNFQTLQIADKVISGGEKFAPTLPAGIIAVNRADGSQILVEIISIPYSTNGGWLIILRDITVRVDIERHYSKMINNIPVGIVMCQVLSDKDGPIDLKITEINPQACKLIHKNQDQVINRRLSEIFANFRTHFGQYAHLVLKILEGNHIQQEILIQGTRKRNFKISGYKSVSSQIILFIEDYTDFRIYEKRLQQALKNAEESNQIKSSIFMNLSHEFRTPMNAINGFSSLITTESSESQIVEYADRIYCAGQRLLRTLDDMIDLAKLEAGISDLKSESISIYEELVAIQTQYSSICSEKALTLEINRSRDSNVYAPRIILRKILEHLVDNAIKFTLRGGIVIEVLIEEIHGKTWSTVKIKDTGIGIEPLHHRLIFNAFHQVSRGYGRFYEGAGLGLTIVYKLVQLLNGKIRVESEVNAGSVFTVQFPTLLVQEEQTEVDILKDLNHEFICQVVRTAKSLEQNFLIVEDNHDNAILLQAFLKNFGHSEIVYTDVDALLKAREKRFDCVFMDIGLGPQTDGLKVARFIKQIKGYENVPIIAVTGYSMLGDRERILAGGCDFYISKPFRKEDIGHLMEDLHKFNPCIAPGSN